MKGFRPERHKNLKHRVHTCLDCYYEQDDDFKKRYNKKLFKLTIETLLNVAFEDVMVTGEDLDLQSMGRFTFVKYKPNRRAFNFGIKRNGKFATHLNLNTNGYIFTSWWTLKFMAKKKNISKWKCTLLRGNKGLKKKYYNFIINNNTEHISTKTY